MILDSSAVIAVVFRESQHEHLEARISEADSVAIGAPTLFETAMVAVGLQKKQGLDLVLRFVEELDVEVVSFDDHHRQVAEAAFDEFGKGRHPASLNYGDCMCYATARVADQPLLFVGNDFAQTDIAPA